MNTVHVQLGERSYEICIGSGILTTLGSMLQATVPSSAYFAVVDESIEQTHGTTALDSIEQSTTSFSLEALESNKTCSSLESIWSAMLASGCDRTVPVVTIGGGIIGDVGGFAAASFMRGVPYVQVPTTLLAMVDASIGGKTGINLPLPDSDLLGKNLAGSFWQPSLVVADVAVLQTLDAWQVRCGLAECVKHAMLGHQDLLLWLEEHVEAILRCDATVLIELVTQCAQIKADVVAQDERESGCRALLNLGHTFGHCIETIPELALYHGEAVSIGLCAAMACGEALGTYSAERSDRVRGLLETIGLPTRLPLPVPVTNLILQMQSDKKTVGSSLRVVVPTTEGAEVIEAIEPGILSLAWASVGASV